MTGINEQAIAWVMESEDPIRQIRIETVRIAIGMALIGKYDELREDLLLVQESLGKLCVQSFMGSTKPEGPEPEVFISSREYSELHLELGGAKGLWTNLWNTLSAPYNEYVRTSLSLQDSSLSNQHRETNLRWLRANQRWGRLFNDNGELSVTRLSSMLDKGQLASRRKFGERSRQIAQALVRHKLDQQEQ